MISINLITVNDIISDLRNKNYSTGEAGPKSRIEDCNIDQIIDWIYSFVCTNQI
jgi:hypothetical protein